MPIITGTTQVLGVIGDPIEHSLSPVMHNAALATLSLQADGLDYVYVPLRVQAESLDTAVAGLAAIGCCGFNVTIPHKQTIMPLLQEMSAIATTIGAVNTVWRTETGWAGTNTDVQGFLAPLQTCGQDWQGKTATILGTGGAARAAIAGCLQLELETIHLVGRTPQKLKTLQIDFGNMSATSNLQGHNWDHLPQLLADTHLLINTTPVGMPPQSHLSPIEPPHLKQLPDTAIVYDLIYTPNPTLLLKYAQQQGYQTIHGLEMLIQQGAAALEIWLKQPAPIDLMRRAAATYLFG